MNNDPTEHHIDTATGIISPDDSVQVQRGTRRGQPKLLAQFVAAAVAVFAVLSVTANTAEASQQYKYIGAGWTFELNHTNCNTVDRRLETRIDLVAPANWEVAILQNVYERKSSGWTKVSSNQTDWLRYRTNGFGQLQTSVLYNNRSSGSDYHVNLNVSIRRGPGYAWINADDAVYALTYRQNGAAVQHPWACRI